MTLGEAKLIARLTPGHTRGCTTWLMQVRDRGKPLNVVIIGSPNVNPAYQLVANQGFGGSAGSAITSKTATNVSEAAQAQSQFH